MRLSGSKATRERLRRALMNGREEFVLSTPDAKLRLLVRIELESAEAGDFFAKQGARVHWVTGMLSSRSGCVKLSRTELRLFGALVAANGRAVRRERLIAWTWPETSAAEGTNALTVYIHLLRQRLATIGAASALETIRRVGYRLVR